MKMMHSKRFLVLLCYCWVIGAHCTGHGQGKSGDPHPGINKTLTGFVEKMRKILNRHKWRHLPLRKRPSFSTHTSQPHGKKMLLAAMCRVAASKPLEVFNSEWPPYLKFPQGHIPFLALDLWAVDRM